MGRRFFDGHGHQDIVPTIIMARVRVKRLAIEVVLSFMEVLLRISEL